MFAHRFGVVDVVMVLTHLRPLVCVPFVFRPSRLVLSVARFLLVQARGRRDEKGALCKRSVILAKWEPLV